MYFPKEVWRNIFDFDPTFKGDVWKSVMASVPKYADFQYEWAVRSEPYPLIMRWNCLEDDRHVGCWVYEAAPWLTTFSESISYI